MRYEYKVGDRVRCVSKEKNAPVGIVGTVTKVLDSNSILKIFGFDYMVKYDPGQNEEMDAHFPDGPVPEEWRGIELYDEEDAA
jgi:hypothetical protein